MNQPHPVQVIAVTGGKGGVGKSNVSINLSLALAELGRRVILMDADLGLANIDVLLGITSSRNIGDVLAGTCTLREVLVDGPGGIRIVPASSGTQHLTQLGALEHAGLINAFSELGDQLDVLIIDTAAGISEQVISFLRAAQEVLVVVCDEPTSITDAYALIKVMNKQHQVLRFRVLANQVRSEQEGRHPKRPIQINFSGDGIQVELLPDRNFHVIHNMIFHVAVIAFQLLNLLEIDIFN